MAILWIELDRENSEVISKSDVCEDIYSMAKKQWIQIETDASHNILLGMKYDASRNAFIAKSGVVIPVVLLQDRRNVEECLLDKVELEEKVEKDVDADEQPRKLAVEESNDDDELEIEAGKLFKENKKLFEENVAHKNKKPEKKEESWGDYLYRNMTDTKNWFMGEDKDEMPTEVESSPESKEVKDKPITKKRLPTSRRKNKQDK